MKLNVTFPIALLAVLLVFSSFSTCKDANQAMKFNQEDFKILKAYTMPFAGGREGVNGTYYKVELEALVNGSVTFDSLYIQEKWHWAVAEDENPWVVMASIQHPRNAADAGQDSRELDINIKRPIEGQPSSAFYNKNVLAYKVNGERRYIEVGEFRPTK